MVKKLFLPLSIALIGLTFPTAPSLVPTPFTIQVVDEQTGQAVPNLRVTTDNGIVCYTRDNGDVAWRESSLMGRDVGFTIKDRRNQFDKLGATLQVTPGGQATLKVHRRPNT